jgi:hypothetical protein
VLRESACSSNIGKRQKPGAQMSEGFVANSCDC